MLDEGPGIPEAERHRVFERFNRGPSRAPHGPGSDGGTGLGLAIARWAVDLHGGRIGVAESPRGCRIQVTLPGLAPRNQGHARVQSGAKSTLPRTCRAAGVHVRAAPA